METPTTAGQATGDLLDELTYSVWIASVDRLRRYARQHLSATVTADIDPVRGATTALCPDDSEPATVTVSYFPGFEGAAHRSHQVCLQCAEWWMREAVRGHRTTYLDVEVRRMDPRTETPR